MVALVVGLTFHEFSHAFLADQLGAHRPRALGRVSLNPVRHIDPMGAVMLVIVGFGWAKPVPVNPYALRPGRRAMSLVAAGGPIANVVVALAAGIVFRGLEAAGIGGFALQAAGYTMLFNFALAIFNLVPIPPLDGYNIVLPFLPPNLAFQVQRNVQYGVYLLLAVVLLSYLVPGASPFRWIFDAAGLLSAGWDDRDLLAAALLHDCAKGRRMRLWHRVGGVLLEAFAPGLLGRLAAPDASSWRHPFHLYLHHAGMSAELALAAGCTPRTAAFITGATAEADAPLAAAFRSADDAS